MPGMVAFGRRWSVATDDFFFVGIIDTIFFFSWFCWTAVVYTNYSNTDCLCENDGSCTSLHVLFAGSTALALLNVLLAISFIVCGSKGTIFQPEARRHVVTLVYVKVGLSTLDLSWAILGSVLLSHNYFCSSFDHDWPLKVITFILWFAFGVRLFMVWLFYDPQGRKTEKNSIQKIIHNQYFSKPAPASSSRKWKSRFQALCFWFAAPSKDRRVAINVAAELLAFMTHELDMVASDFMAGVLLYRRKCLENYNTEKAILDVSASITLSDDSSVEVFPTADMPPWMNLQLASRYFAVMMGVFGWKWHLYRNFTCGVCNLWKYIVCCFPCRRLDPVVEGDNCCGCDVAGLRITSGLLHEDLVHVCFVDGVYQIPFYVAADSTTNSIVVTIRGSMSCADFLTDLAAGFSIMDDPGCSLTWMCHGGILTVARRIKVKLDENKVLEKAFAGREDYNLVFTGHSLGGGVASVLTLLMRNSYPNVRCYAFTPPPVFNEAGVHASKECVFTVVYGNDTVPYLNYWNIGGMVEEIFELLKACSVPKYKLLLGCHNPKVKEESSCVSTTIEVTDVNSPDGNGKENSVPKPCIMYPDECTNLFIPGKVLHIRRCKNGEYRLRLCAAQDYRKLVFRPNMVYHHFPQFMEKCLKTLGASKTVSLSPS